jgi:hypothetical protein
MNDSNPENIPETPVESQPAPAPQFDARRRLRELLSTPERDRTDEQWDEIIELEIQLAPATVSPATSSPVAPTRDAAASSTASRVAVAAAAGNRKSIGRAPTTIAGRVRTSRSPVVAAIRPDGLFPSREPA